jgi:2-oxoglutarate ferredoxin oxidoreductase subunit beta
VDFVPLRGETTAALSEGAVTAVTMPDGSVVRFHNVGDDYDPTDRPSAMAQVRRMAQQGVVATGLLFIDQSATDMHGFNGTVGKPLIDLPFESLCPGGNALGELMDEFR